MLTWDECLERGTHLSRAFNGRIPMTRLPVMAFEATVHPGRSDLAVILEFPEFPKTFFQPAKEKPGRNASRAEQVQSHNVLEARLIFSPVRRFEVQSVCWGQNTGSAVCDFSLSRRDKMLEARLSGDIYAIIHSEFVMVSSMRTFFRDDDYKYAW